jgi:hypothetical protein
VSMLPECSDLTGDGWSLMDQQTWRTGRMGRASDWGARAREMQSVTAVRSFEQQGASCWLVTEVIPLVSAEDAALALADIPNRFLVNPRRKVTVVKEGEVSGIAGPGHSSICAYEQETTSSMGSGMARYLSGTAGPVLYLVVASGLADSWSWDGIVSVAEGLVSRIFEFQRAGTSSPEVPNCPAVPAYWGSTLKTAGPRLRSPQRPGGGVAIQWC